MKIIQFKKKVIISLMLIFAILFIANIISVNKQISDIKNDYQYRIKYQQQYSDSFDEHFKMPPRNYPIREEV